MIKKFLNPSDKLTYEKALEQAGERVENLMKPNILVKGVNNSDSRFKFKEKGIKRLFKKEAERERRMTHGSPTSEIVRIRTKKADPVKKMIGLEKDEFKTEPRVIGMSGADPLMEFYVGGEALGPLFKLLGKGALYGLGRYYRGTNYGDWAAAKLIAPEMNRALVNNSLKLIPSLSQYISLTQQPIKLNESGLTSLKFFERRPSRISERERLGIPKGENYYTPELNKTFLKQINDFAEKYGYTGLKEGNYTSEQLNAYARALIDRHNKFYRGVVVPSGKDLNLVKKALGNNATDELMLKHVATHSRGEDINPELYISPTTNAFSYGANGRTAIISRPYKLGKDRTKWFDEGDFNIVETGTVNPKSYNDFLGLVYPWSSPKFLTYNPFLGKKTIPEYYSLLTPQEIIEGEGYYEYIPNPYVQNELISINNPMIFRLWVKNPTLEILSKKTPDVPWQLSKITVRKQGGKMI